MVVTKCDKCSRIFSPVSAPETGFVSPLKGVQAGKPSALKGFGGIGEDKEHPLAVEPVEFTIKSDKDYCFDCLKTVIEGYSEAANTKAPEPEVKP